MSPCHLMPFHIFFQKSVSFCEQYIIGELSQSCPLKTYIIFLRSTRNNFLALTTRSTGTVYCSVHILVEVYSDKASGMNTKRYKDFNRMITDAMNHKFDLIVTRKVYRFARNTVDSLNYIRLLSANNIEVFFVNDGIWSLDTDGELRLTISSALAQDESRKISERLHAEQLISKKNSYKCQYIFHPSEWNEFVSI